MGEPTIENYKLLAAAIVGQRAEDLCTCNYIEKNLKNNVVAKYGVNRATRTYSVIFNEFKETYYDKMRFLKKSLSSCTNPKAIRDLNLDIVRLKQQYEYYRLRTDKNIARAVIMYYTDDERENLIAGMDNPRFQIICESSKGAIVFGAKRAVDRGTFKLPRKNPFYFIDVLDMRFKIDEVAREIAYGKHSYEEIMKWIK